MKRPWRASRASRMILPALFVLMEVVGFLVRFHRFGRPGASAYCVLFEADSFAKFTFVLSPTRSPHFNSRALCAFLLRRSPSLSCVRPSVVLQKTTSLDTSFLDVFIVNLKHSHRIKQNNAPTPLLKPTRSPSYSTLTTRRISPVTLTSHGSPYAVGL